MKGKEKGIREELNKAREEIKRLKRYFYSEIKRRDARIDELEEEKKLLLNLSITQGQKAAQMKEELKRAARKEKIYKRKG